MTTRFDPQSFFTREQHIALHVPAGEVFSRLVRSIDLPSPWAALVVRECGDYAVVPPGGRVPAANTDTVLFVRTSLVEAELCEDGLSTSDGFSCAAVVRLRLSIAPEQGDLVSFLRTVQGSRRVMHTEKLAGQFRLLVRAALATFVGGRPARQVVDPAGGEAAEAMSVALRGPLFAGGISLDRPPIVTFDCPGMRDALAAADDSARRRALHEAQRPLQEALQAAQNRHLDHLQSLLSRLKELASLSPEIALPQLMRTFSEQERSQLYGALFSAARPAGRTRWIVVAAGDELLFYVSGDADAPRRRVEIRGGAGPIRSVQASVLDDGSATLWLGAARGVYRLSPEASAPDVTFLADADGDVQGGFNTVACVKERVFASHSELGVWQWTLGDPVAGRRRFALLTEGAKAVRGLCALGDAVLCGVDHRVLRWAVDDDSDESAQVYRGSRATITALCPTAHGLFAGNSDGDVLHWATGQEREPTRLHMGMQRPVESLALLETGGVPRLVYADTSLHLYARVLGDSFTCRYEAGGQTLRRVEVADDLFVATNELRDRLICFAPGSPSKPTAVIPVSSLCGRSIQDVCLVA